MSPSGRVRALLGALALAAATMLPAVPASASHAASMVVTPSNKLVDGQRVSVVLRGAKPASVWAVAECGPGALSYFLDHSRPSQDGCEQRTSWVMPVDAGKIGALSVSLHAVLTTAAGAVDCRTSACFVALQELTSIDGSGLKLANLSFSAGACAAARSCRTAPDAWSPLAGRPSAVPGPVMDTTGGTGIAVATSARPASLPGLGPLDATAVPERSAPGPVSGALSSGLVAAGSGAGQGVLALSLSAPGTSWGPGNASAVVADVSVTDTTTSVALPTQQVVLYRGGDRFTYTCGLGMITAGHQYAAAIAAEPDMRLGGLSQLPAKSGPAGHIAQAPRIVVADAAMLWIDASSPIGLADRYAPVIYGRSTSALHDTPLVLDATTTPTGGGGETIDYTAIFSHEDAGTAYVPSLELTSWGRLTDIETVVHLAIAADGSVTSGTYFWGGVPKTGYPDSDGALQEVSKAFSLASPGQWEGTHPVIRVATGNNDVVAGSTSPFRFDLPVVAGPQAGAGRWYANLDGTPTSPQMGDVSQYVVGDLATSVTPGTDIAGLALEVEVSGTWFAADQGWGFPLVSIGHLRTTVKLPFGWSPGQVQGVRVAVSPASAASAVTVDSLSLLHVADDGTITPVAPLVPTVVGRTKTVAPVLSVSKYYAGSQHAGSGFLDVRIADALGYPLDGVSATMTLPKQAYSLTCATCRTISGTSGSVGPTFTGLASFWYATHTIFAGLKPGTTTSVTTEDHSMLPVTMTFDFGFG